MSTKNTAKTQNQAGQSANKVTFVQEAIAVGNYSLARKLAKGLMSSSESPEVKAQAQRALQRICIDPRVIWIGLGALAAISLLSIYYMNIL